MSWARSSSDKVSTCTVPDVWRLFCTADFLKTLCASQASPSRPDFARDSASSMAESPSPSGPNASNGKENQLSGSSSSGLFSKYKGKYKTYLAERRANSKSKASQELDSVAEAAIASNSRQASSGKQSAKEAAAAAQAADNAALDKDMDAFFEEVSQIKVMDLLMDVGLEAYHLTQCMHASLHMHPSHVSIRHLHSAQHVDRGEH